jgi:hypothetical protein
MVSVRNEKHSGTLHEQLTTSPDLSNQWPPVWRWVAGTGNRHLDNEPAVLQSVAVSEVEGVNRCHLLVEYQGSHFVGTLVFEDIDRCLGVYELLLEHCGESIQSIAGLPPHQGAQPAQGRKDEFTRPTGGSARQSDCRCSSFD